MRTISISFLLPLTLLTCNNIDPTNPFQVENQGYVIVDTGQDKYYDNTTVISKPGASDLFNGQDAHYTGNTPSYLNNGDGTITDKVTGLMWQQDPGSKMSFEEALEAADRCALGGYNDWRLPGIKELYSLILFTGLNGPSQQQSKPFIDTDYFIQPYGDISAGERFIDAQTWSATEYSGTTMNGNATAFGVNFVDGRIKGYPKTRRDQTNNKLHVRLVRGNSEYGKNQFVDNGDGTISDLATRLMWQKADDGTARDWKSALEYSEKLEFAGYSDWRLPNAKELHSIVDYTKSPRASGSAAIDPVFDITEIEDPEGNLQYPYFWSSTTREDGKKRYTKAVYFAFGEAQGIMNGRLMDVHGAGAQRSDPKYGNQGDYPQYIGPQGDLRYVYNYVRCVRDIP